MRILGLSAYYHDSAACLVVDGEIVAAAQEERFTREKHDASFPARATEYCLAAGGLKSAKDLDLVVFYEKPLLKFERLLSTYVAFAPAGLRLFLKSMPIWLRKKLWLREDIQRHLDYSGDLLFTEHHQSHAASAFYPSPFQEAAVVTMDGVGEWATTSIGYGNGNELRLLKELHFPHSLGLLYSAFTYFTGFKVNSGEYKLMGLAPYGNPKYVNIILKELIDLRPDGSFRLNMAYFNYCAGLTMVNEHFDRLFEGPPRTPETALTQRELDLAASIQEVTEQVMLNVARHAHELTGCKRLVMAGGVALNCVGNGRILREGPFSEIWAQPASGDAGGALGAALFAYHQVAGQPRKLVGGRDRQQASRLGPCYDDVQIGKLVGEKGLRARHCESWDDLVEAVVELLSREHVVGWFQGRMEFGPRALGSRSIIADARSPEMQSRMNLKIKFRESFRPFAPSILLERCRDYFDLDAESPYMLLVAQVRPERRRPIQKEGDGLAKQKLIRSEVPAVTHVDYSARVQTVSEADDQLYYKLLRKFEEKTGCPVLVNTSFNVRGEPIVCTPEDAWRCFVNTNIDALAIGRYLINRADNALSVAEPSPRRQLNLD